MKFLHCFTLYSRANSNYKPPRGAYIRRGDLTESFLRHDLGGLIFGGAYFRNFTVDCDVVIEGYEYCMPLGRAFNTCKQISVNYNLFILIFGIIGVGIYSIEDGIQSI